jgi:4-hydroxyphenylpyruvate dioxygenase-like putative hemolysin
MYHLAPEIFVSDGDEGSIVGDWVSARNGIGGIHHLAYQVDSVQKTIDEWRAKGYAEFTTENPLVCPDLTQVFTKPSALTGVIYEFIERGRHGFCKDNVKDLMESTKDLEAKVSLDHHQSSDIKKTNE